MYVWDVIKRVDNANDLRHKKESSILMHGIITDELHNNRSRLNYEKWLVGD